MQCELATTMIFRERAWKNPKSLIIIFLKIWIVDKNNYMRQKSLIPLNSPLNSIPENGTSHFHTYISWEIIQIQRFLLCPLIKGARGGGKVTNYSKIKKQFEGYGEVP